MWKVVSDGIMIPLKVIPKAHRNSVEGWKNGELHVRLAAQPEKGEANAALIAFLAKELQISKQQIKLISGATSRHKRVCISGIAPHSLNILES